MLAGAAGVYLLVGKTFMPTTAMNPRTPPQNSRPMSVMPRWWRRAR
jgi:hypothetical protein